MVFRPGSHKYFYKKLAMFSLLFMLSITWMSPVQASTVWVSLTTRAPRMVDYPGNVTYMTSFGIYSVSKATGAIQYTWINGTILSPATKFVVQYLKGQDSWEDFELSQPVFMEVNDNYLQWRQTVLNGSERHGYVVVDSIFSEAIPPKLSIVWDLPATSDFMFRITFKVTIPQAWGYFINGEDFVNIPQGSALSLLRKELRVVESPEKSVLQLLVDWSDYGQTEVLLKGSTITVVFSEGERQVDPTVSGSASKDTATRYSHQRKLHYINNRYWAFTLGYTNQANFTSSSDGIVWENQTYLGTLNVNGDALSTTSNSTHLAYVRLDSGGTDLYYRVGTPESNGSITWADAEQTAWNSTEVLAYPDIAHDSDGYPYIVVMNRSGGHYDLAVIKSDLNNGTWSTALGYPLKLFDGSAVTLSSILSLTSTKMYVLYSDTGAELYGRLFNGTDWESAENISTNAFPFSAVSVNDEVHVVYTTTTGELMYQTRTGSSWSSATTLETDLSILPQVSLTKDGSKLFAIWSDASENIYVKALLSGSWTSSVLWTSQSDLALRSISSMYEKAGSKAGAIWTSGTADPYTVTFEDFDYTATAGSFTIYADNNNLPVSSASWDYTNKKLTFRCTDNITVDTGVYGQPFTVFDGENFLSWSMSGSNISFTASGSSIEMTWQFTSDVETKGIGGDEPVNVTDVADIIEPVVTPLGQLGLYGLLISMGVVAIAGVAQAVSKKKVSRKPSGKGQGVSIKASGKGTTKKIGVTGGKNYGGNKPKGVRRKKQKWD